MAATFMIAVQYVLFTLRVKHAGLVCPNRLSRLLSVVREEPIKPSLATPFNVLSVIIFFDIRRTQGYIAALTQSCFACSYLIAMLA